MSNQRLYIQVDSGPNPRFHLPWNYHMSVQSFVYDALNEYEPEKAAELHQSPHAPPWSYSNFIHTGPFQPTENGLLCERGYFVFASDTPEILNAIANYANHNQELQVGHTKLPVESVEIETFEGDNGTQVLKTLSPIAISERSTETPRDWFLPEDPMWFPRLKSNVEDRIEHIVGTPQKDVQFKIESVYWHEPKLKKIVDGAEIPCSRMTFEVDMSAEVSEFVQTHGLGEKTGMGFGAVIRKKDIPSWWR